MSKLFLSNIDLAKNQILNVTIQNLASHPSNPVTGQIYYNTADLTIYLCTVGGVTPTWVSLGGDITEIIAGDGLSGGGTNGPITLDINVDNASLEISSDIVRIKDSGVTTSKINNDAVTTVKILDSNITFSKIQNVPTMTVIGRVASGTGVTSSISILDEDNLGSDSDTALATQQSIKAYVDSTVASLGNLQGGFDATLTNFPVASGGTNKSDYWYVTVAGSGTGTTLNVGDILIAKIDAASTTDPNDWIFIESNRDQATTTTLGVVILATNAEVQTGTDSNKVVTPSGLSARTATETRTGIAELATQAETNAGTDDERIVTPLKLKTFFDALTGAYAADVGNGVSTSFVLAHNLGTKDVIVVIRSNATDALVETDIVATSTTTVTISFNVAPTTNAYRVVVKK